MRYRCRHLRNHPVVLAGNTRFWRVDNPRPGREVQPGEVVDFAENPAFKGASSGWELLEAFEDGDVPGEQSGPVGLPTVDDVRQARATGVSYEEVKTRLDELTGGLEHARGWDNMIAAYAAHLTARE